MTGLARRFPEPVLRAMSRHVWYEYETLCGSYFMGGMAAAGQAAINARVESCAIHARNLTDFFYPPRHLRPRFFIRDFFEDSVKEWDGSRPEQTGGLARARRRASKEAAHLTLHLTLDRPAVLPEGKPWPFVQIIRELTGLAGLFHDRAAPGLLSPEWRRLVFYRGAAAVTGPRNT